MVAHRYPAVFPCECRLVERSEHLRISVLWIGILVLKARIYTLANMSSRALLFESEGKYDEVEPIC
jgi:hypothetical protein